MALVTLDYLKDVLGITTAAEDTRLQAFLDAADRAVKNYCQVEFEQATYTEYHTGNNQPRIALRQVPVNSVTSVHVHQAGYFGAGPDAFGSTAELTEGTDWVLDAPAGSPSKSGVLYRIGTVWPMLNRTASATRLGVDLGPAWGNVKVVYSGGYATVPADLKMAVVLVAQHTRLSAPHGGKWLESEKIGDYSYTLADQGLHSVELGSVRTTLAAYKNLGW